MAASYMLLVLLTTYCAAVSNQCDVFSVTGLQADGTQLREIGLKQAGGFREIEVGAVLTSYVITHPLAMKHRIDIPKYH